MTYPRMGRSVLQEWIEELPMMQQTVLLTAIRGPDNTPKYGPAKMLLRWFRRCVLHSAMDGAVLRDPVSKNGGSFTGPSTDDPVDDWERGLRDQCTAAGVPFFFKQWGEWKEWRHDVDGPYVEEIGDEEAEAAAATIAREVQTPGWLTPSGHFYRSPEAFEAADGDEPGRVMERIGKRAAGRLLDGVEHSERPQP